MRFDFQKNIFACFSSLPSNLRRSVEFSESIQSAEKFAQFLYRWLPLTFLSVFIFLFVLSQKSRFVSLLQCWCISITHTKMQFNSIWFEFFYLFLSLDWNFKCTPCEVHLNTQRYSFNLDCKFFPRLFRYQIIQRSYFGNVALRIRWLFLPSSGKACKRLKLSVREWEKVHHSEPCRSIHFCCLYVIVHQLNQPFL